MKTVKELMEERAVLWNSMQDLLKRAQAEGREMTPDEDEQFDKADKDLVELSEKIERAERISKRRAEVAEQEAREQEERRVTVEPTREEKEKRYNDAFWKYTRHGMKGLNSAERDLMVEFRGTDPQTTTNAAGGFTIPQGFSNELFVEMAAWGGMLEAARIFRTATGNQIDWPTVDDTSATGAILTEGSADTVADITFANKNLDAYMYTSKVVKVSIQLLQDSYFDLPGFLRTALGRRLGTATNAHFTTGSGSSQPNGFVTSATVGKTSASNSTVTANELIDLAHSVNAAYRRAGAYMLSDNALGVVKKLNVGTSDSRPIWIPSMREGEPSTIWGYPYYINYNMASFAANAKPIAFGDFQQYIIRIAGDPIFLRLDERYMDALLVGFSAYVRMDGETIGQNAIKVLRNPAT